MATTGATTNTQRPRLVAAGLVLAVCAAYANSFNAPFVFDDIASIRDNVSLRSFGNALTPPAGLSVSGRPVANLSFALSHALGGGAVWAHHFGNVACHAAATLALFGLVRRTLVSANGEFGETRGFSGVFRGQSVLEKSSRR